MQNTFYISYGDLITPKMQEDSACNFWFKSEVSFIETCNGMSML